VKYLVLLLVLGLAFLWWNTQRKNARRDEARRETNPAPPAHPTAANTPQDMVQCAVCAVHLPRSDAVTGRAGIYCSSEHRAHAEP
jgi:uncharacterized protein